MLILQCLFFNWFKTLQCKNKRKEKKKKKKRGEKLTWDGFCQPKYPLMLTKEICNTVNVICENIFNNKLLVITNTPPLQLRSIHIFFLLLPWWQSLFVDFYSYYKCLGAQLSWISTRSLSFIIGLLDTFCFVEWYSRRFTIYSLRQITGFDK